MTFGERLRSRLLVMATGLVGVASVALIFLAGCTAVSAWGDSPQQSDARTGPYTVVHISDGDTVSIDDHGAIKSVRLVGVDTPETKRPNTAVQCFGREASAFTERTLLGQNVWLERDAVAGNQDRYGRELGYLWLENGTLFNRLLISQGYGREYDYQDQNYKYRNEFREAENMARANSAGLWASC